jgi:OOP family OmpA-OmpF porin
MPNTRLSIARRLSRFWAGGCLLALLTTTTQAWSFVPEFSGLATVTATLQESMTSYRLPIGPFANGAMQTRLVEGALDQTSWRITAPDVGTLSLLAPLRDQLRRDGWAIIYECETDACGGFDFRFGTEVTPEPDMHVDLGDFRFLSAERTSGMTPEYLSLLVSRSAETGFAQLIRVGAALPVVADPQPGPVNPAVLDPGLVSPAVASADIGRLLETTGTVALDDLVFASGSAALEQGDYPSLKALSAYLEANPTARIALVGHTDASGSLAINVALSRQRAASVRNRLVDIYGADAARISAEGVGYLAPRASNLTPEGRTANRRVEVMLTSTQLVVAP